MTSKPHSIQATDDLDALRLFVDTAAENNLPDNYEAKVTVGFMRALNARREELEHMRDELRIESLVEQFDASQRELARAREAVRVCGRHLYDCCRTDIDWKLQMETHDQAVNAVAWVESDEPHPGDKETEHLREVERCFDSSTRSYEAEIRHLKAFLEAEAQYRVKAERIISSHERSMDELDAERRGLKEALQHIADGPPTWCRDHASDVARLALGGKEERADAARCADRI